MAEHPCVSITRIGIADINGYHDAPLKVNDRDLIAEIEKEMKQAAVNPVRDYEGRFAARVTLIVECLGDMEQEDDHAE